MDGIIFTHYRRSPSTKRVNSTRSAARNQLFPEAKMQTGSSAARSVRQCEIPLSWTDLAAEDPVYQLFPEAKMQTGSSAARSVQLSGISHWRPFLSRKQTLCSPLYSLHARASNSQPESG